MQGFTYVLLDELETFVVIIKSIIKSDFVFETMERILHAKNYNVIYIHLLQLLKFIYLPISIYKNIAFVNNQI